MLLFVKFALSTGARVTSILHIKRSDININTRAISIYDFKNKSSYTGYMSTKLFPSLEFLECYKPHHLLFYNNNSKKILGHRHLASHIRPIYNDLFNKGLALDDAKNRVVNHTLRHTFASHLAINGVSLFEIQKLLNHKDIKMTLRYMKLAEENKINAVERLY